MVGEQEYGGPEPDVTDAEDLLVNPSESFMCKFAGKGQKEGFFGQ